MDVAYDHIQQEETSEDPSSSSSPSRTGAEELPPITLEAEFQQAFKAVSASPWGARLGGFLGQVKKQSSSLYSDAQKEYAAASEQASRGLTGLINHTRNISLTPPTTDQAISFTDPTFTLPEQDSKAKEAEVTEKTTTSPSETAAAAAEHVDRPESLPADIVKEATSLVSRFRSEAPSLLTRFQKAEDAADEALLKFGSNLRNFLREAVTVTGPEGGAATTTRDGDTAELLFETNDAEGKRVFHSSRFDAQLHVIHTTPASFVQDPEGDEFTPFASAFDIDGQTGAIARDLDNYDELRRAMEKLVPEKVEYATFWRRYYFLRTAIEAEEKRRKEVLKGAAAENEEELGWGSDDSDNEGSDGPEAATPHASRSSAALADTTSKPETKTAATPEIKDKDLLKPASPRKSEDGKSTAGSDASYDIVSGATSRAPGSPKEEKKDTAPTVGAVKEEEESDEEDWE